MKKNRNCTSSECDKVKSECEILTLSTPSDKIIDMVKAHIQTTNHMSIYHALGQICRSAYGELFSTVVERLGNEYIAYICGYVTQDRDFLVTQRYVKQGHDLSNLETFLEAKLRALGIRKIIMRTPIDYKLTESQGYERRAILLEKEL